MGKFYRPKPLRVLDCGPDASGPLFCPAISRPPKRQRTGAFQDAAATSLLKFVCAIFILVSESNRTSGGKFFYFTNFSLKSSRIFSSSVHRLALCFCSIASCSIRLLYAWLVCETASRNSILNLVSNALNGPKTMA